MFRSKTRRSGKVETLTRELGGYNPLGRLSGAVVIEASTMSKTALLFAGQGAQKIGMGRDLAEACPAAHDLLAQAQAVLGYDLGSICFNGPETELTKTEHAQPGIYLVSWMAFAALKMRLPELRFEATAGLSLGEYAALAAAGAMPFEQGLRLVWRRGLFMQEACEATKGSMAAVTGMSESLVRDICAETGAEVANLNCPGQIVISGQADAIDRACGLAKERGAKRAVPLQVAGAFHSKLMASAAPRLAAELADCSFGQPVVPVISNVTARPHESPSGITRLLADQVTSTVRWEESMRYLLAEGFTRFVELGPGTVLTGFMKRMAVGLELLNVGDTASLESAVMKLKG